MLWLILALVLLVVVSTWATWTAMRVDRLAARCDAAWQSLDAQLVRRAAAFGDLADQLPQEQREPAHQAARQAMAASRDARAGAENALSARIDQLPPEAVDDRLAEACARVQVARTFYNDAVRAATALRAQRLPRLLGMGRGRPVPPYFDIDDDPGT